MPESQAPITWDQASRAGAGRTDLPTPANLRAEVINYLASEGPRTWAEIAYDLDYPGGRVYYAVRILVEQGKIRIADDKERPRRYEAIPVTESD
jgi:hypothetical protein